LNKDYSLTVTSNEGDLALANIKVCDKRVEGSISFPSKNQARKAKLEIKYIVSRKGLMFEKIDMVISETGSGLKEFIYHL